ncbi:MULTISPECIES: hypothetical protein [Prauserella salsuginis group]|uniref:Uncharacterized protein n=1 Tax=Prauserella salsuginis TaxID=387889 RepID=A0ABW6G129_9PSEU|nr:MULTISPECIES: hypothetical protein [Prauserella salsuginis group]
MIDVIPGEIAPALSAGCTTVLKPTAENTLTAHGLGPAENRHQVREMMTEWKTFRSAPTPSDSASS